MASAASQLRRIGGWASGSSFISGVTGAEAHGVVLLRASGESPRDHIDLVQRARAGDVEGFLPWPAERDALAVGRRTFHWDGANVHALRAQDLDAPSGGYVEPAFVVDGQ